MNTRRLRTIGLLAVLIGVLVMAAARFGAWFPPGAIWAGLAAVVFGWSLILFSLLRRARGLDR